MNMKILMSLQTIRKEFKQIYLITKIIISNNKNIIKKMSTKKAKRIMKKMNNNIYNKQMNKIMKMMTTLKKLQIANYIKMNLTILKTSLTNKILTTKLFKITINNIFKIINLIDPAVPKIIIA